LNNKKPKISFYRFFPTEDTKENQSQEEVQTLKKQMEALNDKIKGQEQANNQSSKKWYQFWKSLPCILPAIFYLVGLNVVADLADFAFVQFECLYFLFVYL
jgi:Tfp pilus assembly protein PilN